MGFGREERPATRARWREGGVHVGACMGRAGAARASRAARPRARAAAASAEAIIARTWSWDTSCFLSELGRGQGRRESNFKKEFDLGSKLQVRPSFLSLNKVPTYGTLYRHKTRVKGQAHAPWCCGVDGQGHSPGRIAYARFWIKRIIPNKHINSPSHVNDTRPFERRARDARALPHDSRAQAGSL
jgi:hypothetical protein